MCGIAGIVGYGDIAPMLAAIEHRGPDQSGTYINLPVQLGIDRLSIIDLKTGDQPIFSADQHHVIVYNGEVFNYRALRAELESLGRSFRTKTDTEVVLNAFLEWGEECVSRFIGQWAFCIYDIRDKVLFISRDRMGEKPLYFYHRDSRFLFGSEIKALLTQKIDTAPDICDEFWAFEQPHAGSTLFRNIEELTPGHNLTYEVETDTLIIRQYWRIQEKFEYDNALSEAALIEELRWLLEDAAKIRMIADVPVGVCLSGGIDSSAIVCLTKPDLTFSCRFPLGDKYDEYRYAELVADHVGCEKIVVTPTAEDLKNRLSDIIYHLDQPVATASPIGDFMVAEKASHHVKVLLGGQGSDEAFGGYARYLLMTIENELPDHYVIAPELKSYLSMMRYFWRGNAAYRYFQILRRSACLYPEQHAFTVKMLFSRFADPVDACGYTDIHLTLPSLIQMNDRSSSAYGIENRNPFLDHRLIEFGFRLPARFKIRELTTKYLLRKALRGIVPDAVLDRQDKKGLVVPFVPWLSGPLKEWKDGLVQSLKKRIDVPANGDRGEFDRRDYTLACLELWFRRFFPEWWMR